MPGVFPIPNWRRKNYYSKIFSGPWGLSRESIPKEGRTADRPSPITITGPIAAKPLPEIDTKEHWLE